MLLYQVQILKPYQFQKFQIIHVQGESKQVLFSQIGFYLCDL